MAAKMPCDYCKKKIDSSASRCPYCQGEYAADKVAKRLKTANDGQKFGCAILVAILVGIYAIGSLFPGKTTTMPSKAEEVTTGSNLGTQTAPMPVKPIEPESLLTPPQQNAARSAKQYISMTGFSRKGLIDQLSSSAGEGYEIADATAAVDSLSIDWDEQAARSAKQYLKMSGFSCKGLVDQLSSSAGEKYTTSQARYGAKQAGAC